MGILDAAAKQLAHAGQAFLDLADRPGTFKLPRDLGATPAQIVANASTPKLPLTLMMPHEVAAKNEYLAQHAFDAAKAHVDKMAANMAAKGTPMTPSDYADRLDKAQAWNYAQHKNLQLFGNDENYLLTTPHGWAAIATPDLSDPSRTAIEALNLNSAGAPGGGGANAYQALLALTKQQGLTNFTKELTPENTVRKPMNLMSHIARTGDTSHLELDPSFWGPAGLGLDTPTAEEFSQLSVPAQLGYLANVGKENADYALTKARYPHGLDTFMQDSAISPSLVGRDYSAIDPASLQALLGRTGPDSGVGDTALRQAMLTHALNGQYDLMGSATPAMNVNRLAPDFTQGLMYAEGGVVQPNPHEGMEHTSSSDSAPAPLSGLGAWLQHLGHRALHPFDPDVMAETVKNLKDQFSVGQPLGTTGSQDLSNAMNFVNPVGGELHGLMSALAVKNKGGNWFPRNLNEYIGNGVALGGDTHPAVKTWAETQLPRYIKTYLGTAEDPLLQVEQEGNLHMSPDALRQAVEGETPEMQDTGPSSLHFQATGRTTRTPWEQASDALLYHHPVAEALANVKDFMGPQDFIDRTTGAPYVDSNTFSNIGSAADRHVGNIEDLMARYTSPGSQYQGDLVPQDMNMDMIRQGLNDQNYAQGGLVRRTDPLRAILNNYYADTIGA